MAGREVPAPHGKLRVLDAARVGIAAIENACHEQDDWQAQTPCARWDALTLLRHLHAISAEYLAWIDDARLELVGHAKLKAQRVAANDDALVALPTLRPDAHLTSFLSKAMRHLQFADRWWDLTVKLTAVGTWTVGEHVAIAAIEYHLHAWDLRRSQGRDHRAGDATLLAEAWDRHLRRPLSTALSDAERDPWLALLRASGRDPGWDGPRVTDAWWAAQRVDWPETVRADVESYANDAVSLYGAPHLDSAAACLELADTPAELTRLLGEARKDWRDPLYWLEQRGS